jgi:hypothetical protein
MLLHDVLDGFAMVIIGTEKSQSRKLFIARAEIERGGAVDAIHETMKRRVVDVAAKLVGKLLGRPAADEEIMIRTVAILGQVSVFCHKGAQQLLGWNDIGEERVCLIKKLVCQHTAAILCDAAGRGL